MGANHIGHGANHQIPRLVPEGVIDLLEMIDIDADHRYLLVAATSTAQHLIEDSVEDVTIRSTGQAVGRCHLFETPLIGFQCEISDE